MSMIITNFLKKKYYSHNWHFWQVLQHKIVIKKPIFFCPEISVTVTFKNFSSWDRSDPGPFPRMRITSSVTQDGVLPLVVNFLSV